MDDALRKLAQSVQVIRSLHRKTGGRDVIPVGDPRREENLAAFQAGNYPDVPHVVFHGTKIKNIDQFHGQPNWFAEEPYKAGKYARGLKPNHGDTIYPAHISLRKPLHIHDFDMNDKAENALPLAKKLGLSPNYVEDMGKNHQFAFEIVNHPHFVEAAMQKGFDGIIANEGGYKTFGTFLPNQIKSSIGNSGNFDPNDPDIRKADGGDVEGYATKGAVMDPLELAKSVKPLHRSGGGRDDAPRAIMGHNMPPEPMETSMPTEGLHPHLISQRLPTAVKTEEDPINRHLLVNLQAAKQHKPSFSHNVNLMKTYNQLHPDQMQGSDDDVAEQFINHYKNNLLAIHDAMEPGFRDRTRHWYVGANKFANSLADRHGVEPSVAAASLAATSPQKDWFQNASIGERIMDIHHNHQDTPYTRDMEMTANRIFGKGKFSTMLDRMRGKTYGELTDPKQKAAWIRLFDETYHDPSYRSISPTGELGDFVKTGKGQNARMAWGSLSEIAKGVRTILAGGTREANSDLMGERHKIRNFYNNILDPHSPTQDVTVDTHAVAGAHLMPYGANGTPVAHNFKNSPEAGFQAAKGSNSTGIQGTYPFYTEAVRRAAQERGVEPREMQSITWEGARALFPDTFKTPKNIAIVDGIWKSHQRGEISADQARKQILDFAGAQNGVIHDPSQGARLEGVGGLHEGQPHSTYQRKLSQTDVHGQPTDMVGGVGGGASSQFTGLDPQDIQGFSRHRQLANAAQAAWGNSVLPSSFRRLSGKNRGLDVAPSFDAPISAVHSPTDEAKEHFESAGISAPNMLQLARGSKSAKAFHQAIIAAQNSHPNGSSVTAKSPEEYKNTDMFMSPDGGAGFALDGDDIVSVFNHAKSPHRHVSNAMMQLAIQQGGRRLDAYDTALPHIYSRNKMTVSARTPWNEEYTPENWNHSDYAQFKNGRPDVVTMAFNPKQSSLYDGKQGKTVSTYDEALDLQQKDVAKANKQISNAVPKTKLATGGTVRRAYMKGGKVEGSIWHGKDANVEYGVPTNSAIVQHVLAKIAAPLPATIYPQGSVTGRRQ